MKRKVLLLGANGQLGQDLRKAAQAAFDVVPCTHADLELKDAAAVRATIERVRPAICINTAAFLNVDLCETEWREAFAVNAFAVKSLAESCREFGVTLVQISTDYVFDGTKGAPYTEDDAPAPLNMYGLSKLMGEYFVRMAMTNYFIVRSSGLYGVAKSSVKGTNIVESFLRFGKEGKANVVTDQTVNPTATHDLAAAICRLLATDRYGVYHATNEGACTWFEFAQRVYALAGMTVAMQPIAAAQLQRKAHRPNYSVLANDKLAQATDHRLPPWGAALKTYMEMRGTHA